LKFIANRTITLVFLFALTQLFCAKSQSVKLNKAEAMMTNAQVGSMEELNISKYPVSPPKDNGTEENSDFEELSEEEMLSTKKTIHFFFNAKPVKLAIKSNTKKLSNEYLSIITPPPKV